MKKLLLLGGSRYLRPIIETAHQLGIYVITCDYLPDNYAHKISDEYQNVSIVQKEKVLCLARKLEIDGVMSFACDPGVETAAYVAENLGLPSCGSYESVCILQNKEKFRQYLKQHGFRVPKAKGYSDVEDAAQDIDRFSFPVMIKPIDSAGSKGVTKVDDPLQLPEAAQYALKFSKAQRFIIEEFIEKDGYSSDSECFSVDGRLVYASFSNQYFDGSATNPFTPAAFCWPASLPETAQNELRAEIQRLVDLLRLRTSIYNVETRLGTNGKPYIMEVSPRGGGNRLAEMLKLASGTDLIKNAILAAVGEPVTEIKHDPIYNGCWAEIILHADRDGVFCGLWLDSDFEKHYVFEKDIWVKDGEYVHSFTGANETIGTLILHFDTDKNMRETINSIEDYVKIVIRPL